MINVFQKRILILAVRAGEIMMKAGAEIYRVEDTVTRICKAGGISYVDVFATPTGIFVTMDEGKSDSEVLTYVKRIHWAKTDLKKISDVNRFSREFTTTDLSVDEGMKILSDIEASKPLPFYLNILGAGFIASFFSLLFGGGVLEFAAAFFIGIFCFVLSFLLDKIELNFFIRGFTCCFAASFLALTTFAAGFSQDYGCIIIGVMMMFAPGVAITNSIRDFLSGDMLSGLARMAEAVMIALSLAAGAGIMLKLWILAGGSVL